MPWRSALRKIRKSKTVCLMTFWEIKRSTISISTLTQIKVNVLSPLNFAYISETTPALNMLRDFSANNVEFNCFARRYAPLCLSGTREAVLGKITESVSDAEGYHICWIYGEEGSGKSTIAQSIANQFFIEDPLGASQEGVRKKN
jgi:polynucleotide 5'-kinase involved in rRNA processing